MLMVLLAMRGQLFCAQFGYHYMRVAIRCSYSLRYNVSDADVWRTRARRSHDARETGGGSIIG